MTKREIDMNNKLLLIVILIMFVGAFITTANAKNLNFLCSKKQNITVTLKNETNLEKAKAKILEIPQIKIIKITDRNKEWSKYVNKYDDLPNMQNPFKNEFVIKTNKKANLNEVLSKIKEMDFIEDVKYVSDTECIGK